MKSISFVPFVTFTEKQKLVLQLASMVNYSINQVIQTDAVCF